MIGSGACVALFGAAYFWQIHSMTYFIAVQVVGGEFQCCCSSYPERVLHTVVCLPACLPC